jgi:tetrapyrrole methylase family protein/MazG family protein
MPGITLLGLGPGDPSKLTRQAWDVLASSKEIWLRTNQHPTLGGFPPRLKIHSFDDLYENCDSFEEVYAAIVEKVMELAKAPAGVVYAVPGDPFVAESTSPEIAKRARAKGIPLRIVNGLSFLEPVFAALGLDPYPHTVLLDALELSQLHVPPSPPDQPILVSQIYSRLVAAEVKMTLNTIYPDDHPVSLVHAAGTDNEFVEQIPLFEMDRSERIDLLTVLYVPPLGQGTSFESFQEIVAHLRAPNGCPWDREQTHASLRTHLMGEAYEALAAMDAGDPQKMAEEFGDLLLQIVLNSQIASEEQEFTMADVLKGIHDKIIHRHPHVFGDLNLNDVQGVLKNWEKLKADERAQSSEPEKGILDGVPLALPALTQAQEYQERAAHVGFDWKEVDGVLDKILEEVQEVRQVTSEEQLNDELGDLIFSLVNLARWKKIDAEAALRRTSMRFRERFAFIEQDAKKQGRKLTDLSLEEMEVLWQRAKKGLNK